MPTNVITSTYDGPKITVSEMMADPTYIPQRVMDNLDGALVENLFFRQAEDNKGVVAFQEATAGYLNEGAEEVAEFGEIPIASPVFKGLKAAYGVKVAQGIRVSYEQKLENKSDQVTRSTNALQKTVILTGLKASQAALNAATVPALQASAPWVGGEPDKDLLDAIEMVLGAHEDDDPNKLFGYKPDTLLVHPQSYTKLIRNEKMQKYYIGNIANENPVFKGQTGVLLFGQLQVAQHYLMPPGVAYVFESGAPGFRSNTIPPSMTPMYCEGGESPLGGPTMSWRADYVHKRAIGIDNPKACVKITGIV